jgi:hypothetical protein
MTTETFDGVLLSGHKQDAAVRERARVSVGDTVHLSLQPAPSP